MDILRLLLPILLPLPALAEVPRVVTDIPPVQALTAQVMGDLGDPVLLLEKGADEHDFQLRPSQMQALSDAGLVIWVGPELTPWLDRALQGLPGDQLALLHSPGTRHRSFGAAPAGDDHDHGAEDPHAWLDPGNASLWLTAIAAELSRLDPDHAAAYASNAATAQAGIAALDQELAGQLAPLRDRPFVTFHDAYGYFTAHYALNFAGSLAFGDASSPGAARVDALRNAVAAGQVQCLFPEVQHDPALLAQVMEGSTARLGGPLDPVGSSLEPGPGSYATLMRGLADTLQACLAGGA